MQEFVGLECLDGLIMELTGLMQWPLGGHGSAGDKYVRIQEYWQKS